MASLSPNELTMNKDPTFDIHIEDGISLTDFIEYRHIEAVSASGIEVFDTQTVETRGQWFQLLAIGQDLLAMMRHANADVVGATERKYRGAFQKHLWALNPLRAKFFRGNKNIYLHFMSLLHIDMTQVVEIYSQVRQGPTDSTKSRSWLLMSWWRKEPGHQ